MGKTCSYKFESEDKSISRTIHSYKNVTLESLVAQGYGKIRVDFIKVEDNQPYLISNSDNFRISPPQSA